MTDEVTEDERLRIAIGMNDTVIRHLFAIGLDLHTTRSMVDEPARERLSATVDDLDAAIRELRALVFDLQTAVTPRRSGPWPCIEILDPQEFP